jgi:glycosyltransferase involved in cell wall biosynthesis
VHFVSRVDCDYLARLAPGVRTHWVPLGVAVPPASALDATADAEEPATLVFVANMLEIHGAPIVEFVRETLPAVRREVPAARLLVVGANAPEALIEAAQQDAAITLTGYVPDTFPYLARGSVALCLNTLLGGMQTKVLGAMAVGKAVIGRPQNFTAIEGAVDGTHYVSAGTRETLASNIIALLRDPARRRSIGRAAHDLMAGRYTWDTVLTGYAQLALPGLADEAIDADAVGAGRARAGARWEAV